MYAVPFALCFIVWVYSYVDGFISCPYSPFVITSEGTQRKRRRRRPEEGIEPEGEQEKEWNEAKQAEIEDSFHF